ncbi:MAG TPA: hypothetical protein VJI98_01745 [Candidatus Nanoarchaeia archaeon]|nr:hypothetical protein [Candidatus Nanoarchaeia archaeon]
MSVSCAFDIFVIIVADKNKAYFSTMVIDKSFNPICFSITDIATNILDK